MENILILGLGYVGLSNGLLLSRKHRVEGIDTNKHVINLLSKKQLHIDDPTARIEIKNSSMTFSLPRDFSSDEFDFIILALPTNYDEVNEKFDTSFLDIMIKKMSEAKVTSKIIIKSTVPMGYTEKMSGKYKTLKLSFSPEFLREGSSFYDALNPSRVIVSGGDSKKIGSLFKSVINNKAEIITMGLKEAEAVKLFSNTYLAMRVAFVNELATFSDVNGIDQDSLIKGVSTDPRIGGHYFRPSMGYGGYCLPKDSKQLLSEFVSSDIKSSLFDAIVKSNEERKKFIAEKIILSGVKEYTFDGLGHKPGVSNYRNSPVLDVAKYLMQHGVKVFIKDDFFRGETIEGIKII